MCPPFVRLVSVAAPPNLVQHLQTLSGEPDMSRRCVRLVSALAVPPNLVRHVSAMCPPSVFLVVAWAVPPNLVYVRFGFPLQTSRPCACLALYLPCVSFGRTSKRCVSHVALCLRHVCAPCLFFVLLLFARSSLFSRSLSVFGRVYGLALAGRLCSLVFAPSSVLCPLLSA